MTATCCVLDAFRGRLKNQSAGKLDRGHPSSLMQLSTWRSSSQMLLLPRHTLARGTAVLGICKILTNPSHLPSLGNLLLCGGTLTKHLSPLAAGHHQRSGKSTWRVLSCSAHIYPSISCSKFSGSSLSFSVFDFFPHSNWQQCLDFAAPNEPDRKILRHY